MPIFEISSQNGCLFLRGSANSLSSAWDGCLFMWGAHFCMSAYKRDVVVVIKMGAYIHGCLFCVGAYYSDFTVCLSVCF